MSEIEFNPIEESDIKLSVEAEINEVYPFVYTIVKEDFGMNFKNMHSSFRIGISYFNYSVKPSRS